MYTDPNHLSAAAPGQINGNVVFTYLDAFHPDSVYIDELKARYQKGGLGDGTTKKILEECLQELLKPIRQRREIFMADKAQLIDILRIGSQKAQQESNKVLNRIKSAFGLSIIN